MPKPLYVWQVETILAQNSFQSWRFFIDKRVVGGTIICSVLRGNIGHTVFAPGLREILQAIGKVYKLELRGLQDA